MTSDAISPKDLRDRTDDELVTFVQEKSEELFKLRFQHYTGQLENTARLKTVRREIARARTIITQRGNGTSVPVSARLTADAPTAPAAEGQAEAEDQA
ncbi:MAG: 50S ribosomal protein L29 [Myxococcota bacterium]